jgi:hypothetical protein
MINPHIAARANLAARFPETDQPPASAHLTDPTELVRIAAREDVERELGKASAHLANAESGTPVDLNQLLEPARLTGEELRAQQDAAERARDLS